MKLLLNRDWYVEEIADDALEVFRQCSVYHSVIHDNTLFDPPQTTIFVTPQKITLEEYDMIKVINLLCYPYSPNEHPEWNPVVLFDDEVRLIIS